MSTSQDLLQRGVAPALWRLWAAREKLLQFRQLPWAISIMLVLQELPRTGRAQSWLKATLAITSTGLRVRYCISKRHSTASQPGRSKGVPTSNAAEGSGHSQINSPMAWLIGPTLRLLSTDWSGSCPRKSEWVCNPCSHSTSCLKK